MEQVQISPEIYEQVKAMVLNEQRETARERARQREEARKEARRLAAEREERERNAIKAIVDPFRYKYTPLLAKRHERTFVSGGKPLYDIIHAKLDEAMTTALRTVGIYSVSGAYRCGELERAIQIASEILDAMLKN